MVEKVVTPRPNVVDFARYQQGRNAIGNALAISASDSGRSASDSGRSARDSCRSARACRHCGAALSEGENEDDCSTVLGIEAPRLRKSPRKFRAD
jgi:hypothetical protein